MKNPEETIGKMIDKSSTSFVSYVDEDGYPITKAMLKPRKRNGIKEIWFSTNTSSDKVRYFRKNNKASVYFFDKRYFRGVSLIGTIEVLETAEAKELIFLFRVLPRKEQATLLPFRPPTLCRVRWNRNFLCLLLLFLFLI